MLSEIRIGVLPDANNKELEKRYRPLLQYLSSETGMKFKLLIPESYQMLGNYFASKRIDMAWFGGVSFVKAHTKHKAQALVVRDVDLRFTSLFLVKADHPAKTIFDLKGQTLGFGSDLSTSGHIMPRHFMSKVGINADTFFSKILFSGKHDTTAHWVRDGKVAMGVANSEIIRSMFAQGVLKKEEVRILWETPPYTDYVWAVQETIPDRLRTQIRDAFLNLSTDNEAQRKILNLLGTDHFLPAGIRDFEDIHKVLVNRGLL